MGDRSDAKEVCILDQHPIVEWLGCWQEFGGVWAELELESNLENMFAPVRCHLKTTKSIKRFESIQRPEGSGKRDYYLPCQQLYDRSSM